ncbi:MAG TPA: hypothetical protein VHZ24_05455 [Pirellulales bacterium]|jgi:hypothetical protein|nr:hypothetical protein [Pirellulales bacterium]
MAKRRRRYRDWGRRYGERETTLHQVLVGILTAVVVLGLLFFVRSLL